jgi:hypothetical protein
MFGRAKRKDEPSDELAELRRSALNRGQADIAGAARYVDAYLQSVAEVGGTSGSPQADLWLRDRLRMFVVLSFANWFDVVDRIPEAPALKDEWRSLCFNAKQFGPQHLIAWWWLLQEPLFRPLVDNQLEQMRGALTDGVRGISNHGGDFAGSMVDWEHFFDR